jgi:hypothetical protein
MTAQINAQIGVGQIRALIAKNFNAGWNEYTGPRHEPFYSIQGLFDATKLSNVNFEIEYENLSE